MPKIIRKAEQSLQSQFLDWLVQVYEELNLIEWDILSRRWAIPVGAVIHSLYYVACTQKYERDIFDDRNSLWLSIMWALRSIMIVLALGNFIYCFTRRKSYHGETQHEFWEPSTASLRLLCVFSPVHAYIQWLAQPYAPLLNTLLSAMMLYLTTKFEQHVIDKKLIYGQVFSEYEKNFVAPRLSIMKRDVGIGTEADDNGVYVEVHTPKVGIIDSSNEKTIPRSASQIRMHDWEASPNVWASPIKRSNSARLSIASPVKAADGSPVKLFKPAGWSSSVMKKSKTMSSLSQEWE